MFVCEYRDHNPNNRSILTDDDYSLLTALSASQGVPQKSWYNAHLTRRLYRMEQDRWSTVKSLILRFIDMQAAARQPRPLAMTAMVNDIEIVVDPRDARPNALESRAAPINPIIRQHDFKFGSAANVTTNVGPIPGIITPATTAPA